MQDEARLGRLSANGRQRLLHVREVLALAFAHRARQHPRRWLEGVWLMLGGPRCLEAPEALGCRGLLPLVDKLAAARNLTADTLSCPDRRTLRPARCAGRR
jgi:ATP-dependent helicase/nuclease subunit A